MDITMPLHYIKIKTLCNIYQRKGLKSWGRWLDDIRTCFMLEMPKTTGFLYATSA
jgi:hypothetical protein